MGNKKMFRCVIADDQCKGCGRCVKACPLGLLEMGSKLNVMSFPFVHSKEGCTGCSACYYNCPEPGAITIVEEINEEEK